MREVHKQVERIIMHSGHAFYARVLLVLLNNSRNNIEMITKRINSLERPNVYN